MNPKTQKRIEALLATFDSGAVQPDELIKAIDAVMAVIDANGKSLVDTLMANKAAGDKDVEGLKAELKQAKTNLERVISDVKMSSEANVTEVRVALLNEIRKVEALIPELPPETDLSEVFEEIAEQKEMLSNLGDLVLGENIRNALESIPEEEDKLKIEAVGYLREELDKLAEVNSKRETNFGFVIRDVVAGTGVTIDKTDPNRPIVSASAGSGSGDVVGPASATDNAIARFDATTGKLIQNSVVTVSDTGEIDGATTMNFDTAYTPTGSEPAGTVYWNDTDFTLDLVQNGAVLQIGQEMNKKVRNATGATLTEGTVVYENGQLGNRATIAKALSDAEATSRVVGVLTEDILNNADGKVTTEGLVRQIKTDYTGAGVWGTTWVQGDLLYVSKTTAGQLTNVEPTVPHHSDIVGKVSIVGGAGIGAIEVHIQRHKTLAELSDVNGTPLSTTGQLPVWDNTAGYFDFTSNITDFAPALGVDDNYVTDAEKTLIGGITATAAELNTLDGITATVTELNYTVGVTSAIQTQLDAKASLTGTETLTNKTLTDAKVIGAINAQTGTTYTLVLTDASKHISMSNASANTLTVPPNASVAFPTGTRLMVQQLGAGATTIAAGAGVTINAPATVTLAIGEQYESRGLLKTDTDTWQLI